MKISIKGLWVPLLTPIKDGLFDEQSASNLIEKINPYVDGYAPCLSTGEGSQMSDKVWQEVLSLVLSKTNKPVLAGILKSDVQEIITASQKAKELGCFGVVIPVYGTTQEEQEKFYRELSEVELPILIYSTDKNPIANLETLKNISQNSNIIGIKDSSGNQGFFNQILASKKEGQLEIDILQGMENQLLSSAGCDGYLISLANVEPELSKEMFENPSEELNAEVMKKWDKLNLASDKWYVNLKEALVSKYIIKSAETLI